jgi:hypothetical protein
MDNSPVAMPYPYGWIQDKTLEETLQEYEAEEFFTKARIAAKLADLSAGMEDPGDTLSRQVGGTHYKKGVQPWTIALDWGLDPWSHNVVKYILRFPYKNGKEDLEKISHYVDFLLENYDEVTTKYYK